MINLLTHASTDNTTNFGSKILAKQANFGGNFGGIDSATVSAIENIQTFPTEESQILTTNRCVSTNRYSLLETYENHSTLKPNLNSTSSTFRAHTQKNLFTLKQNSNLLLRPSTSRPNTQLEGGSQPLNSNDQRAEPRTHQWDKDKFVNLKKCSHEQLRVLGKHVKKEDEQYLRHRSDIEFNYRKFASVPDRDRMD